MLNPDQQAIYEKIRQTALRELEVLDREIASELARVKTRLLELQNNKKAVLQILDGASARLGVATVTTPAEIRLDDIAHYLPNATVQTTAAVGKH